MHLLKLFLSVDVDFLVFLCDCSIESRENLTYGVVKKDELLCEFINSYLCELEATDKCHRPGLPSGGTTREDVLCPGLVRGPGGFNSPLTCRIELSEMSI